MNEQLDLHAALPVRSNDFSLRVCVKPLGQFGQSLSAMRDLVLLDLGHLGICLALIFEACIPTCGSNQFHLKTTNRQTANAPKSVGPRASTILPCRTGQYACCKRGSLMVTNLGPSLENDGFVARAFRVCECAHSLGALVVKSSEKLVELLDTERLQEPLAVFNSLVDAYIRFGRGLTHMGLGVHRRRRSTSMCLPPGPGHQPR